MTPNLFPYKIVCKYILDESVVDKYIPSSAIISFLLLNKPKLSAQFLSLFDKITPSKTIFLNYKLSPELPAVSLDQFELLKKC